MKTFSFFQVAGGLGVASAYTVTNAGRFMLKNIVPIVTPGQYTSHMHSFFGSDAVTANTTTSKELQAGCSTAVNPNDYSAYSEVAVPQSYKAVAGNASATSSDGVDPLAGIQWFCEYGGSKETKDRAAFPTKGCGRLQTLLLFHDCVNEEMLESAYSGTHHWTETFKPTNRCLAGMKRMPQLRFSIRYDLRDILPDGWDGPAPLELSCGSSFCSHGDFINGWLPEAAENMLLANHKRDFKGVNGPNGKYNAGPLCKDEDIKDADPEHGTSNYAKSKEHLV
ncbi:hypothetical protein CEP53_006663 [Fusarium sp. AF-6]|nr:hypothetical protein CEP53_006663 [Fusarium sp. AF-6]